MMNQTSSISLVMQLDKKFKYTDEELMKRFQNGDENAYIELVNRYRDKILNFIFNYIGDFEISEDTMIIVSKDTLLQWL